MMDYITLKRVNYYESLFLTDNLSIFEQQSVKQKFARNFSNFYSSHLMAGLAAPQQLTLTNSTQKLPLAMAKCQWPMTKSFSCVLAMLAVW
jgi:hypothetical protein